MPCYPAWAKINLGLKVGAKRSDGYHDILTVMQTVSLSDRVELTPTLAGINLEVVGADLPLDERNLAVQAAKLMKHKGKIVQGANIKLTKMIPLAAGLAGGSADAAAVLYALNELWQVNLSLEELLELGTAIGSDVPFALHGGTALAQGRGEIISPLPSLPDCYFVLACPNVTVSTAWAYQEIDRMAAASHPVDIPSLVAALDQGDLAQIAAALANSFEPVIAAHFPIINDLKQALLENGALAALMSGSGPTVFGVFTTEQQAERAAVNLKPLVVTHLVRPVSVGAGRFSEE